MQENFVLRNKWQSPSNKGAKMRNFTVAPQDQVRGYMENKKTYFKNIEFLRFLMIIDIILFHLFFVGSLLLLAITPSHANFINKIEMYSQLKNSVGIEGHVCVNFFFIISGFFLLFYLNKNQGFIDFLKSKFIRLWPVLFAMWIAYFLLHKFGLGAFNKYSNIFPLLFLNNSGLTLEGNNIGGSWFVSALMVGLCFYFYIYKHFPKYISDFITSLLTIFCYSFLLHAYNGTIDKRPLENFYYVLNSGVMQSLAGIGLGIIICNIYNHYKEKLSTMKESLKTKLIFTFLEFYLFFFLIHYLTFHKINYNNEMIYILAFCGLFFLFLIKKGYLSKFLENNVSKEIGKYTYSIFLGHGLIISLVYNLIWLKHPNFIYQHPVLQIFIVIFLSTLFGMFLYHFIEKKFAR